MSSRDGFHTVAPIPFRFESSSHTYTELATGAVLPSITQLLERGGFDDGARFFTEESRRRGTAVHQLTAGWDLGMIERPELEGLTSEYKGYLLGYVAAVDRIAPAWDAIEEPRVHPRYRFGGRPDRAGTLFALRGVCELKSGAESSAHPVQTALQAILEAERFDLPAELVARFVLYLKPDGRFRLVEHKDRRDFNEAYTLIRRFCE